MYIWRGIFGAGAVVTMDSPRQIDLVASEREVILFLKKDLIGLRNMKRRRASRSSVIAKKVLVLASACVYRKG